MQAGFAAAISEADAAIASPNVLITDTQPSNCDARRTVSVEISFRIVNIQSEVELRTIAAALPTHIRDDTSGHGFPDMFQSITQVTVDRVVYAGVLTCAGADCASLLLDTNSKDDERNNGNMVIIASSAVVGGLLLLVASIVLGFVLWRKHRNTETSLEQCMDTAQQPLTPKSASSGADRDLDFMLSSSQEGAHADLEAPSECS